MAAATEIRQMFADCLARKLAGDGYHSSKLTRRLLDYVGVEVVFGVNKMMKVDKAACRPRTEGFHIGGLSGAGDNADSSQQYISTKWTCTYCQEDYYGTPTAKLEHLQQCRSNQEEEAERQQPSAAATAGSESPQRDGNPLKRDYFCPECDATLWLTAVEILRHKRQHM